LIVAGSLSSPVGVALISPLSPFASPEKKVPLQKNTGKKEIDGQ